MSSPGIEPDQPDRRRFLKVPLMAGAAGGLGYLAWSRYGGSQEQPAGQPRHPVIDEHDERNIKLAHRVASTITDDDILFLQQIGLRWMRVEFRDEKSDLDRMAQVQKRFEKHGIRIYSAVHPAYRSLPIQLGQQGRDQDIDTYRTFLQNLGKLGIPLANYDFHPANTYTTATVQRRGYTAREFNLNDFRTSIEKPGAKIEPVEIREVVRLFGGQGTINVNSWSPDSKRFAYVSYAVE